MSAPRCTSLAAAAAGALLLAATPGPLGALRTLRTAGGAAGPTGPLVAAVALLAWALVAWLAAVTALTVAGRLPGLLGRACAALSRVLAPAAVRRAVEVALGLSLAVGAVGAGPAAASPGSTAGASGVVAGAPAAMSLDWSAPAGPSLDWATASDETTTDGTAPAGGAVPAGSLDWPGTRPPNLRPPALSSPEPARVVVQPGDTLWGLAEQSLRNAAPGEPTAAQVAQVWPSWWNANRDVVGDDPDLLRPGATLAPPGSPTPDSPTPDSPTPDSRGGADGAGPAS